MAQGRYVMLAGERSGVVPMKFLLCLLLSLPLLSHADEDADFLALRDAFRKGDAAQVQKLAPRFARSPLEPYASYYALRLDWDAPQKRPEIKVFLARERDTPLIEQFRSEWLKHLAAEERWQEFGEEYPRLLKADEELACYALQYRYQKDRYAVLREARAKWFNAAALPGSCGPLFDEAIAKGVINEQDIWSRIRLALEAANVSLASQLAERLPKKYQASLAALPKAASDPEKYLAAAKLEKANEGQRLVALFALQRLARQVPGLAYEQWQKISKYFPESERQYFYGWQGYIAARALEPQALEWYKAAGDAPLTENQLAWRVRAALRAEDWHEVWVSISNMPPSQQSESAWRYWKARALKGLGRGAAADVLLAELSREYHFYGQLAAEELGAAPAAGVFTVSFQPDKDDLKDMEERPASQRTLALYRMDMRVEAAREWAWLLAKFNDRQLLIAAEMARRNGMHDRSIYAADRTVEIHDFNLRYPAPYRESLNPHTREFGLDEAWVYGLMRQESRFVTQAKSNVGAAGLMQVMPATARWVAKKLNMRDYHNALIHEMDVNLKLGTFYMKNVLSSFDESPVLASAAYNAGPTRARRWRGDKPLEGAIYAETIPFDETRDYVKKVMSNTIYYSKLFGQPVQSLKQRLGVIEAKTADNQRAIPDER